MTCCGHGFEEHTGRDVSISALGGIGPWVLYHLLRLAPSVPDYTGNPTDAPVTLSGLSVDGV
jgi:hypothetical protein